MRVGREELAWWLDYYSSLSWVNAKSYEKTAPHHYVVRGRGIGWREGEIVLSLIRSFGEPQKYWSMTNIYLVGDGMKWWSNAKGEPGEDPKKFVVINMAPEDQLFGIQDAPLTGSPYFGVYDTLALDYDELAPGVHDDQLKLIIQEHLLDAKLPNPKTLDVGAGTGRLFDLEITRKQRVVAVDPSRGMLNGLVWKYHHPPRERVGDIRAAKIEDVYEEFIPGEFDLVVGLYGSPSYVYPGVVEMLPLLTSGLTVLMTYKPGYLPEWWRGWEELPPNVESVAGLVARMGGERYELGNYWVDVIENRKTLF